MHKSLHRVQPGSFSSDVENGDPKHLRVNVAGGYPSSPKKSEPAGTYFAGRQVQPWHCRAALACAQTAFVIGSVYLKHCLQLVQGASFHPLTYAFAREAVAGPILLLLAWASTGRLVPKACDALRVAALGGCLFANQLLFILGISLSGVLVATCIQPTIPVFTLCIALATRAEQGSAQKFAGIASAVGGSMMMVLGGISSSAHHSAAEAQNLLLGNACLLGNTLSMSVYFVLAKTLVAKYPPLAVTAWAYVTAACAMGAASAAMVGAAEWGVPRALYGPLLYWILVCSVGGYWVVTAATAHLPASQVAAFQCLQPFIGTVLAASFLGETPTWWDLGALGVLAGLALVATDKADAAAELRSVLRRTVKRILSSRSMTSLNTLYNSHAGGAKGSLV